LRANGGRFVVAAAGARDGRAAVALREAREVRSEGAVLTGEERIGRLRFAPASGVAGRFGSWLGASERAGADTPCAGGCFVFAPLLIPAA
jgi:hypothetical protein